MPQRKDYRGGTKSNYFCSGVAYIVDDVEAHNLGRESMCEEDRKRYLTQRDEGLKVLADAHRKEALSRKFAALEKQGLSHLAPGVSGASTPARKSEKKNTPLNPSIEPDVISTGERAEENQEEEIDTSNPTIAGDSSTLFPSSSTSKSQPEEPQITIHSTAPTSHNPPTPYHKLPTSIQTPPHLLPQPNPLRNPIYRHLHSHGYYLSPGLRFGAQYMAYPGDPLRFHSHFVVNGLGWDEEISVLDIVGGGRLGTGVKKAWMVGGRDPSWTAEEGGAGGTKKGEDGVRVFSVEWGGF